MTDGLPDVLDDPWGGCNPLDPGFRADPYPRLARLRERDPVNLTPIGFWRLLRYADVVRLLRDVRCGMRTTDGFLPGVDESEPENQRLFMLQQDPPTHTRLRKLVSRAFTPRALSELRETIQRVVDECLERVAPRGEMDVIADLALPVPATMICEMLGVPARTATAFTVWTAEATFGLAAAILPPEVIAKARAAGMALAGYFEELIEKRRGTLTDDILSGLIRAEEQGDRLSTPELISQSIGLLIAGFETTIGLIGNGIRALDPPSRRARQAAGRARAHRRRGEECLRYDGPIVGHCPHPPRGRRVRRQDDPEGLDGVGDAGVGQPRPRALFGPRCLRHRVAPAPIIWRSGAARTFASDTTSPSSRPEPRSARSFAASRTCGSSQIPWSGGARCSAFPPRCRSPFAAPDRFGAPDCQARCSAIDPTAHDS